MVRVVFYAVLIFLLVRALNRFWIGVVEGLSGPPAARTRGNQLSVHMVRDPVCGTFVIPSRAVTLTVSGEQVSFCSAKCRDAYVADVARGRVSQSSRSEQGQEHRA